MTTESLPQPPIELLELATGYQRAKILFLLVEFALPTLLSRQPLTTDQIAQSLGMHTRAAESFLRACVVLGLLELREQQYRNSSLAELFLVAGKTTYLGNEFARYDQTSYPMWTDLAGKLRQWEPGIGDDEIPSQVDQGPLGIRARYNLSLLVGHVLGQAYNFSEHRTMLDLGGGTGAMSFSICELHRGLRSIIFDLPAIAEVASELVREGGYSERIKVMAGNFKTDELPSGFDIALLANLLSVASEETNRKLLRRIHARLPDGGAIILSGYILDDDGAGPAISVLFCLQDIAARAPDVERDFSTYSRWLEEAGFVDIERKVVCSPTSMIIGRKR